MVARRRSVRAYTDVPVEPERLERVLRAAARAPSAGNLQAWKVVVVRSLPRRQALATAAEGQGFVAQAPLDLVFFADPDRSAEKYGKRGASLYAIQDATIAATFALLAATDEGLATAWVGAFDEGLVSAICEERRLRPVAILPVGHGAERPVETPRRDLRESVEEC